MDASPIEISSRDTRSALSFKIVFHIGGATPATVFDYLSDPRTVPVWQSDALSQVQLTPGPMGLGTLFDNRKRFLGYAFSAVTEVTAYERPVAFGFRSDGRQKYAFAYQFAPDAGGTTVNVEAEFPRLRGLFALIPPRFLRKAIAAELKGNHLTLKSILESGT